MKALPKELIVKLNFNIDSLRFHVICVNELNLTADETRFHHKNIVQKLDGLNELATEIKSYL